MERNKVNLAQLCRALGPEWNNLEINFELLGREDTGLEPYGNVEDIYTISLTGFHYQNGVPHAHSQVQVFNGPYPVGEVWLPQNIALSVNGHAYPSPLFKGKPVTPEKLWEELYAHIKERVECLLKVGYQITSLDAFRNARGDWPPGTVLADARLQSTPSRISLEGDDGGLEQKLVVPNNS